MVAISDPVRINELLGPKGWKANRWAFSWIERERQRLRSQPGPSSELEGSIWRDHKLAGSGAAASEPG